MLGSPLQLGVNFPISLEANHVVSTGQWWAGALETGSDGKTLTVR